MIYTQNIYYNTSETTGLHNSIILFTLYKHIYTLNCHNWHNYSVHMYSPVYRVHSCSVNTGTIFSNVRRHFNTHTSAIQDQVVHRCIAPKIEFGNKNITMTKGNHYSIYMYFVLDLHTGIIHVCMYKCIHVHVCKYPPV